MQFYDSVGPNPHVVRMFMAEKGIEIPTRTVDLRGGENRREPYVSEVNRRGQCPALKLDNGTVICEVTAICEYLEEVHPTPPLIGTNAEERAETRMWTRRVDLAVCEPMGNGFRYAEGAKMFESRMRILPEAADGLKAIAQDGLGWVDSELGEGPWLCGDRFTMADILLYCVLHFGARVGQPMDPAHAALAAWYERVAQRPAASA